MLILLAEWPTSDEVCQPKGIESWKFLDLISLLKPVLPKIEVFVVVHASHTLLKKHREMLMQEKIIRDRASTLLRAWHRHNENVRHLPVGSPRKQRKQLRYRPGRSRLLPSTPFRSVWEFLDTSTHGCRCRLRRFRPSWWCRRSHPDLLSGERCSHSQIPPSFPQSLKFLPSVSV